MAIGWGFIGTGNSPNSRIAPAAASAEDTTIIACFSRDQARADEFAKTHGALVAYTSVDELLADSRVDVVFVASPNHLHAEHTQALDEFLDEAGEFQQEQKAQLEREHERMELTKGQLDDDMAWVQRESDKVEALIKSQTGGDQEELAKLVEEKSTVQTEIEQLRAQLNLKELEVKKLSKRMGMVEKNIDLTRSK